VIYGFNFLPETGIEKNLGLKEKLSNRIREIHETIGEDAAILDQSEQLNEEAMYAIYERQGGQLDLFEEDDEHFGLNEAEQMLRQMRQENAAEFERIADLRDGIRSAKPFPRSSKSPTSRRSTYVFCQAGNYSKLYLIDEGGRVISNDIQRVLAAIKCLPEVKSAKLPKNYNATIMRVRRRFSEEVTQRLAEREHTLALTRAQRYLIRELQIHFRAVEDENTRAKINLLERAFRGSLTSAVKKEINRLHRNGVTGSDLLKSLEIIYRQNNLRDWLDKHATAEEKPVVKIVCSEALV